MVCRYFGVAPLTVLNAPPVAASPWRPHLNETAATLDASRNWVDLAPS